MRVWAAVLVGFVAAWALALGQTCPTVCVIIPEEDRCIIPRPVPDPACETAIIRAFLSYGFHVVDQQQMKFLRMTDRYVLQHAREDTVFETRIPSYGFLK